ncbi:MAG: MoaD/ThiS family protein [Planctomycetota bacterium]
MIEIRIVFAGPSMFAGVQSGDRLQLEEGTTVRDVYSRLGVKGSFQHHVVPYVNGDPRELEYVLSDGDELRPFVPVSGG